MDAVEQAGIKVIEDVEMEDASADDYVPSADSGIAVVDDERANEYLCASCDDGGDLLMCDSACMRSFHISEDGGCNALQIPEDLLRMLKANVQEPFSCPNCMAGVHQCFVCKQEGSSAAAGPSAAKVYRCAVGSCGRFYHSACLKLEESMLDANGLICPLHACKRCKKEGSEAGTPQELVPCRLCPKAYHVACLPQHLGDKHTVPRRVWLVERDAAGEALPTSEVEQSLIYCQEHKFADDNLMRPMTAPLFSEELLQHWRSRMAEQYPDLPSSRSLLQATKHSAKTPRSPAGMSPHPAQQLPSAAAPETQRTAAAAPRPAAPSPSVRSPAEGLLALADGTPARDSGQQMQAAAGPPPPQPAALQTSPPDEAPKSAAKAAMPNHAPVAGGGAESRHIARRLNAALAEVAAVPPAAACSAQAAPAASSAATHSAAQAASAPAALQAGAMPSTASGAAAHGKRTQRSLLRSRLQAAVSAAAQLAEVASAAGSDQMPGSSEASADGPLQPPSTTPPLPQLQAVPEEQAMMAAGTAAAAARQQPPTPAKEPPLQLEPPQPEPPQSPPHSMTLSEIAAAPTLQPLSPGPTFGPLQESDAALPAADVAPAGDGGPSGLTTTTEEGELDAWEADLKDGGSETTLEAVRRQVAADIEASQATVSLHQLRLGVRTIQGYDAPSKKTVTESKLASLQNAVMMAERNPRQAGMILDRQTIGDLTRATNDLSLMLAPYLHGKRYSSYGRHFSRTPVLQAITNVLLHHLRPNDVVVDFSCGANEFIPMVKNAAAADGVHIFGRAYDIFTARDLTDFQRRSWFEVEPGELPHGNRLVIGLNPPFGLNCSLANKFVMHAVRFNPRIIVILAPPDCIVPDSYSCVYENRTITADRAFYVPGAEQASWNKVAPPLRILIRRDQAHMVWQDAGAYETVSLLQPPECCPRGQLLPLGR